MTRLQDLLDTAVGSGTVPGAAALVARGDQVEIGSAGELEPDSIVRIASITKPITAAAVMLLVDDGLVALDDSIARWLPELAAPRVVRRPDSPIDDVVPAARAITVEDVLTFRAGWGFPSDFSLPAVVELFQKLPVFGPRETPDEWLTTLARVPMLRQPGEAWLYNTCSDIQGVLIARVSGRALPEFLAERILEPLGMRDTGFHVPAQKLDRLPAYYDADLAPIDERLWTEPPIFPSGAGGLVSTLADMQRFGRMLLADGGGLLSPASVRLMTTGPPDSGAARRITVVPRGSRLGLRRRRRSRRPLRLDRRYGYDGARRTVDRHDRHPPHPGADDGADVDAAHAPVLAVRVRHPGAGRGVPTCLIATLVGMRRGAQAAARRQA